MSLLARTSAAAAIIASLAGPLAAQDAAPPAGAPAEAPAPAADVTSDTVLADVNGEKVTVGHVVALIADLPEQYRQLPDEVLFTGVLDQIVQQLVLSQTFADPTAAEKLTLENQDRAVKAGLAVQRVMAQPVSDEELQAAYDAMYADAEPQMEYRAAHILVPSEDEAKAIAEELRNGGDFAAIAKEKSQDPGSAANGGELGWFGLGMMVPEFETAVQGMQPGEVSDPVQTQFGWHIVKLEETRTVENPTLDEMREELTDQVVNRKIEEVIAAATESAKIDRSGSEGVDPAVIRRTDLLGK